MHNNWTYRIYPYEPAMNAVWHNKMPNTPNGSDGWYGIDDIGLPMDRVFLECQKDRRLDPSDYLYLQRESLDGLKAVRAHAKHLKLVEVEGF